MENLQSLFQDVIEYGKSTQELAQFRSRAAELEAEREQVASRLKELEESIESLQQNLAKREESQKERQAVLLERIKQVEEQFANSTQRDDQELEQFQALNKELEEDRVRIASELWGASAVRGRCGLPIVTTASPYRAPRS